MCERRLRHTLALIGYGPFSVKFDYLGLVKNYIKKKLLGLKKRWVWGINKYNIRPLQLGKYVPSSSVRTLTGSETLPKPRRVRPATWIEYNLYFPNPVSSVCKTVLFTVTIEMLSPNLLILRYITWYPRSIPFTWSGGIGCHVTLILVELVLYAVTFIGAWSGTKTAKIKTRTNNLN